MASQLLLSLVIALPLGYYFINEYLSGYTVKISVAWWYFSIPLILLSSILVLTIAPVLYRSIKVNPVNALKN
jgi:ABC-type antimicrobial peptide transport system permease subunit